MISWNRRIINANHRYAFFNKLLVSGSTLSSNILALIVLKCAHCFIK